MEYCVSTLIKIASEETSCVLNEIFTETNLSNDEYIVARNDRFYINSNSGMMQITFNDNINIQMLIAMVMTHIARQIKQDNPLHENYALWMKLHNLEELSENCPTTVIPIGTIMRALK